MMKPTLLIMFGLLMLTSSCAKKAIQPAEPGPGGGGPAPIGNLGLNGPIEDPNKPVRENEDIEIVSSTCPNQIDLSKFGKDSLPEELVSSRNKMEWRLVEIETHLALQEGGAVSAVETSTQLSPLTDQKNPNAKMVVTCQDLVMLPQAELLTEAKFPVSINQGSGGIERDLYVKNRSFGSHAGRSDLSFYNARFPTRKSLSALFQMEQENQSNDPNHTYKMMLNSDGTLVLYSQNKVRVPQKDLAYIQTSVGRYVAVPSAK